MKLKSTEKGKALLTAIECGLIPENNGMYNDEAFMKFWDCYLKNLNKRILWKTTSISLIAFILALIALLLK